MIDASNACYVYSIASSCVVELQEENLVAAGPCQRICGDFGQIPRKKRDFAGSSFSSLEYTARSLTGTSSTATLLSFTVSNDRAGSEPDPRNGKPALCLALFRTSKHKQQADHGPDLAHRVGPLAADEPAEWPRARRPPGAIAAGFPVRLLDPPPGQQQQRRRRPVHVSFQSLRSTLFLVVQSSSFADADAVESRSALPPLPPLPQPLPGLSQTNSSGRRTRQAKTAASQAVSTSVKQGNNNNDDDDGEISGDYEDDLDDFQAEDDIIYDFQPDMSFDIGPDGQPVAGRSMSPNGTLTVTGNGKGRGRKPKIIVAAGVPKDSPDYQRLRKENHVRVTKQTVTPPFLRQADALFLMPLVRGPPLVCSISAFSHPIEKCRKEAPRDN